MKTNLTAAELTEQVLHDQKTPEFIKRAVLRCNALEPLDGYNLVITLVVIQARRRLEQTAVNRARTLCQTNHSRN